MRSLVVRLLMAFLCVVAFLVAQGWYAQHSARNLARIQREALDREMDLVDLKEGLSRVRLAVFEMLGTMNPWQMDRLRDAYLQEAANLAGRLRGAGIDPGLVDENAAAYDEVIRLHYDFSERAARGLIYGKSGELHAKLVRALDLRLARVVEEAAVRVRSAERNALEISASLCLAALLVSLVWAFVLVRNLADRRAVEEEHRGHLRFLETLLDTLPNPVFYTDREGTCLGCNAAFARSVFGLPRHEIVGRKARDLADRVPEQPADTGDGQAPDRIREPGAQTHEAEVLCADGVRRTHVLSRAAFRDAAGHLAGTVGVMIDISDRARAETALRNAHAELEGLFQAIPDAIVCGDTERRILRVNRGFTRVYGYAPGEVLGRSVRMLYDDPADFEEQGRARYHMNAATRYDPYEVLYRKKDGETFLSETVGVPIRDAQGAVVGFLAIMRDVSERKRAEQERARLEAQLQQAQKLESIGTLAGGIAHDFNNILAIITGYTELALLKGGHDVDWQARLSEVLAAGGRARDLVQQILAFSRQAEYTRAPISLGRTLEESVRFLRASLPATIETRSDLAARPDVVLADATQIQQVIMNLCVNAGHAMRRDGGVLEVGLAPVRLDAGAARPWQDLPPGDYFMMTVKDTGTGMTPEVRERIFEPYFTTKGPGEGTGLGLSVVHGIVKSHGGAVRVETHPGRGTTFEILLPRSDRAPARGEGEEGRAAGRSARILFVDDEPSLAHLGRQVLEQCGHQVVALEDSRQALEEFRARPEAFDLLVTDMTMPAMTGEELSRQVLRIRPDLPVILCTGYSEAMTEERAREIGIRQILLKPVLVSSLIRAIGELLADPAAAPDTRAPTAC